RPLLRVVRGHLPGAAGIHEDGEGVDLLGGGEPAAALPGDEPEGGIGDGRHGRQAAQLGDLDRAELHHLELFTRFGVGMGSAAPTRGRSRAPMEPTATMPSAPASQPPSTAPTIPTTMLAMMPICALVFMRMLASQPITPPMTRLTIRPMASPFAWEILAGE